MRKHLTNSLLWLGRHKKYIYPIFESSSKPCLSMFISPCMVLQVFAKQLGFQMPHQELWFQNSNLAQLNYIGNSSDP